MSEHLDISTDNCTIEKDGHVMIVTLNRPEAKNALNGPMLVGLYRAWRRLDDDADLYCAILTGKGDTFCAGMDLKVGPGGDGQAGEIQELLKTVPDVHWQALLRNKQPKKPVILAVEGYALAGGTEILQGADLRVAAEDAVFGLTECKRGLFPLVGSTIRLRRQIPYALAAEMLLLGRHVSAQEAKQWGLINRVVPKGQALAEAMKLASELCTNAPLSVQAILRSLRENQYHLSEAEALEREEAIGSPVFASQDAREGMRAFAEKRPPRFVGK
jgi:enoyl-CoA hydratase